MLVSECRWRRRCSTVGASNTRLRLDSILDSVTRRGTFLGNSAGVLRMFGLLSPSGPPSRHDVALGFPDHKLIYNIVKTRGGYLSGMAV